MKHSHLSTPRTLAECQFDVGYQIGPIAPETQFERMCGYLLAVAIGAGLAAALVAWWSS